jgi:hypothetical protein
MALRAEDGRPAEEEEQAEDDGGGRVSQFGPPGIARGSRGLPRVGRNAALAGDKPDHVYFNANRDGFVSQATTGRILA